MQKTGIFLSLFFLMPSVLASDDIFDVKAKGLDRTMYSHGKIEKQQAGDEVFYTVDLSQKIVTRTAVFNKSKDTFPKGLQPDDTVYSIIYDMPAGLLQKQRLIKAIGRPGADAFETIVIGEDFVTSSRSSDDYFVLYHYRRIDPLNE